MFGARDVFGWRPVAGPLMLSLLAAGLVVAVSQMLAVKFGILLALIPLGAYLTLSSTFFIAVVFTCFSYFRLHEAYTFLEPLKIIGLTGAALTGGLMWRGFLVDGNSPRGQRELKVLALIAAGLTIVFGVLVGDPSNFGSAGGLALGSLSIVFFCFTLALWHQLLGRASPEGWPKEMHYFTIFAIIASIGVPLSPYAETAFSYWAIVWWKICIVVFAVAWLARTEKEFNIAVALILISGGLIAAVAIYNKLNGIDLVEGTRVTIGRTLHLPDDPFFEIDPTKSYGGNLADPNDLAMVLLFPLSFAFSLIWHRPNILYVLLSAIVATALMFAIVYTGSRGGLLGLLAVGGAIGLRVVKNKMLLIAAGGLAALALFAAMGLGERAVVADSGAVDESSMGRLYAWGAALKMMAARPLTGVGLSTFAAAHQDYAIMLTGFNHAAHSTWFVVIGEAGVPGIVIFVLMLVSAFRTTLRIETSFKDMNASPLMKAIALALFAGLCGFCVSGSFLTHGFTWPLYIQLAIIIALWRYERRLVREKATAQGQSNSTDAWASPRSERAEPHATV